MKLRMIGTTSNGGNCPTLYETDAGDIVVQGRRLEDAEARAQLADILDKEDAVLVPRELLTRFAPAE